MIATELHEDTLADLLDRLGGIPAHRVLLKPQPGTATEEECVLKALAKPRNRLCEPIDGTLLEKAKGTQEAVLGSYLSAFLWAFANNRNLGIVMGGDSPVRIMPGNVRYPDVSFIPWELVPENTDEKKIWSL
jgi:Uma2 family endonuclease